MPRKPIKRFTSVRAYRRRMDEVIIQAGRGEIEWKDARAAISTLKAVVETVLTENVMAAKGIVDQEVQHPLGLDGGLDDYAPHVKPKGVNKAQAGPRIPKRLDAPAVPAARVDDEDLYIQ